MKISFVSRAILSCLSDERESKVDILCKRSANLIIMTRISLAIDKNIFMKFSACSCFLLLNLIPDNLVTPSTKFATSIPNSSASFSFDISVSSMESCSSPAMIVSVSIFHSDRINPTLSQ